MSVNIHTQTGFDRSANLSVGQRLEIEKTLSQTQRESANVVNDIESSKGTSLFVAGSTLFDFRSVKVAQTLKNYFERNDVDVAPVAPVSSVRH